MINRNFIYKTVKTALVLSIIYLMSGISAFAASKDYSMEINKEYSSAKITVDLPTNEVYSVEVISPNKISYEGKQIDDDTIECIINDTLKKGIWIVRVSKEDTFTEGEISENASIENVKIKFEGSTEKIADVDKGIVIATDIVGLKMYFKDDNFVAEWSDTACGNIEIEVTDEKSMESLGKETVQGRYYELPLDEKVESIVVEIVPSTSAREEGAEKKYTYVFNNNPDASVAYEDISITNKDEINVHVVLNKPYAILFMANGEEVDRTSQLEVGEYDFKVPTEVGDNNYLTYIIDENGNMRSTAGYVQKDVVAPLLQLSKEYTQINTEEESISIEGKVEDYATFTINGVEVSVEGDHTFLYDYSLKEGMNVIEITASDEAGNVSQYVATVNRIVVVETPIPWFKIIVIAVFVVMLFFYTTDSIKKNKSRAKKISLSPEKIKLESVGGVVKDLISLFVPLIVIFVICKFVLCITVIQSGSMEPSIPTGNTVVVNRLAYIKQDVKRGDIIFFNSPEFNTTFGKRVIGLPGDTVEFKDGYVVINGQYVDESAYIDENVETNCSKTFTVPDGCYFVLGDNREVSNDSRFWLEPYVKQEDIIGRYMGQLDFSFQRDILQYM